VIEGWSFADSLYMTAISVSTVGYGELHPLSEGGRRFTMILIFAGLLTLTGGVSLVTSTLIELRIDGFLRSRRLEKTMNRLTDHPIICGAGRIGRIVAGELKEHSIRFVLIEEDRHRADQIEQEFPGLFLLRGDATTDDLLIRAGIERARGVIAALGTDAENLYLCLAARELNPALRIVARAENEENVARMEKAGANRVISPARTGWSR
jgi:voltage-gated potassium channel